MHSKAKNNQQYADPIFHRKTFPGEEEYKKRVRAQSVSSRAEIRSQINATKKAIDQEKDKINGMLEKLETAKKGDKNRDYRRVMDH